MFRGNGKRSHSFILRFPNLERCLRGQEGCSGEAWCPGEEEDFWPLVLTLGHCLNNHALLLIGFKPIVLRYDFQ